MRKLFWLVPIAAGLAGAHPMGNFSVNHYARLRFGAQGVRLTYVLDLAELPTFELLSEWSQGNRTPQVDAQARRWMQNVDLRQGGRAADLRVVSVRSSFSDGAAGMQVLRIVVTAEAALSPGSVEYADRNFEGRAGWKEIVVDGDRTARIAQSSAPATDLSAELTRYPADPQIAPPGALTARVVWAKAAPALPSITENAVTPAPSAPTVSSSSFAAQQPKAAGTVAAGDYLSRLLKRKEIGWELTLLGLLAAFGLGAMHAMSPGHGKTIVAAYLVGSRGTLKHAGLLGFVVTFTHTFTVFLLGIGVLFFQRYVVPEKIVPMLGAISGLSIVAVGAMLLYRRAGALMHEHAHAHGHHHHHTHHHRHGHHDRHEHSAVGQHGPDTSHVGHLHDHDHGHSHDLPEKVTLGSLIALGVSGGLVPCPSALILMLSAIALGRPALGLLLLVGFSGGLAAVLMGIGVLAVYAKHLLPTSESAVRKPVFQLIPVFSAVVVIVLGIAMTAVSAGWVRPIGFLS